MVKAGKRHSSYSDTSLDKRTPLICYLSPLAKLKARRGLAYNSTKQASRDSPNTSESHRCLPCPRMTHKRAVLYEKLPFLPG